jgi:tight adherence protein C
VMEAGGKKEIAMMVPVVFMVLPITVLFAIYPGFAFLQFSM